ncbi:uncharacterized protein GJ701_001491 [Geothlypis trichas]
MIPRSVPASFLGLLLCPTLPSSGDPSSERGSTVACHSLVVCFVLQSRGPQKLTSVKNRRRFPQGNAEQQPNKRGSAPMLGNPSLWTTDTPSTPLEQASDLSSLKILSGFYLSLIK